MIKLLSALVLAVLCASSVAAEPIVFLGQGSDTRWLIDDVRLVGDVAAERIEETLVIEAEDGSRCEIREDGFSYFPVLLTYNVSENFVASNNFLVGTNISIRMVFSRRIDTEIFFDLPADETSEFSIRRRQSDELDQLSRTRGRAPATYVVGFIKAMFATKYYDELLEGAADTERPLMERRRLYFAKIAANFLYQQHVQDSRTNLFSSDPIILPDGDAYDLLLRVLSAEGATARNTVLGTRYRSFWFIRDRIEKEAENVGALSASILSAASTISECLLSDDGLRRLDPVLLDYLRNNRFYVPSSRDALMDASPDQGFNLWRVIYQNRFGGVPERYEYEEVLERLFLE